MTLDEFDATVPDELRVKPGLMPAEVRRASEFAAACDVLRDAGTPESEIPSYTEWRAPRG